LPPDPRLPIAYLRFVPAIRIKCRRILANEEEAEEVAHESFARLLQFGPTWVGDADPQLVMAWLYRTSTRLSIDAVRRRRRLPTSGNSTPEHEESWWPGGVGVERALAARGVVLALSKRARDDELQAAVLCRVDGLSKEEAAMVLEVSEGAVRRLLERFDNHVHAWRQEYLA
jgi:RNA polymerase sigma-70 factor (ECF subfamily)